MLSEKKKDYIAILIGILGGIKFHFIGTFFAGEIFIYLFVFTVSWSYIKNNKYAWNLFKLALLWLAGAIITDYVVGNNLYDSIKGQVNIIFFFMLFPYVYWLLHDKPDRYIYFIIGAAIISVPSYYIFGSGLKEKDYGLMGEDIWLYYSFVPVAIGVISYLFYRNKIGLQSTCLLMLGFGSFMLFHNSRNTFLSMIMSAVLLFSLKDYFTNNRSYSFRKKKSQITKIFISLFISLLVFDIVYENLAKNRILGEYAYKKYITQISKGTLLSARTETIMGIELCLNKPIIGYGSFSRDKNDAFHIKYALDHNLDYNRSPYLEDQQLPAHSHIISAWMNHGIFGLLFWGFVLWLLWSYFINGAILKDRKMIVAVIMLMTTTVWDIFFSPFSDRLGIAFLLMYIAIIYKNHLVEYRINKRNK